MARGDHRRRHAGGGRPEVRQGRAGQREGQPADAIVRAGGLPDLRRAVRLHQGSHDHRPAQARQRGHRRGGRGRAAGLGRGRGDAEGADGVGRRGRVRRWRPLQVLQTEGHLPRQGREEPGAGRLRLRTAAYALPRGDRGHPEAGRRAGRMGQGRAGPRAGPSEEPRRAVPGLEAGRGTQQPEDRRRGSGGDGAHGRGLRGGQGVEEEPPDPHRAGERGREEAAWGVAGRPDHETCGQACAGARGRQAT